MKMSQQLIETAKYVTIAAEAIVAYFLGLPVRPSCVVLLGRDCWPLFPLIKRTGLPVQYFLWSRLQICDFDTEGQWLTEVPRGALVVDSGYVGSIFREIEKIDPSCQFVLVCSSSSYPELDLGGQNHQFCTALETLPKLTPRACSYTNGQVEWAWSDEADVDFREDWTIVDVFNYNKELCKELGLSYEWAYFTGTTVKERLGEKIVADVYLRQRLKYKGVYYKPPLGRSSFHVNIQKKIFALTGETPKNWKYNLDMGGIKISHSSKFISFQVTAGLGLTVLQGEENGFAPALPLTCAEIAHIPEFVVKSYKYGYYIGDVREKPLGFLYKKGHLQIAESCPKEGYYAPEYI